MTPRTCNIARRPDALRRSRAVLSCPFLLVLLLASLAPAAQPTKAPRPTETIAQKSCVTADCHANIKASAILHGPTSVNACDACHELKDARAHTFSITRDKAELCTYCHEFSVADMPVIHAPVKNGECTGCHDPHGGPTHSLLRESTVEELCARCHEPTLHNRKFLHTPVKQGACDACHPPHAARFAKLVDATGPDLCIACHKEFGARLASAGFTHKTIADEGCLQCHDVHGTDFPMSVRAAAPDLCLSCHDKIRDTVATASYKHTVVTDARACITCHTPHGGDIPSLMADRQATICADCHLEKIKLPDKRVIAAVPETLDANLVRHGPIKDGQCAGCHAVHGAKNVDLLDKSYARTFYQAFAPDQYDLCFSCHDVRLVQDNAVVTAFRNGNQNLHYIHVSQGKMNRSCGVCHATHAGKNEKILREWVQFKKWPMPINFAKTPTGGSCDPGCHIKYGYDRQRPLPPVKGSKLRPALPVIARAAEQYFGTLHLVGKDAAGTDLRIPDGVRPAVILFAASEQLASRQLMQTLFAAVAGPPAAQVAVVVCGPRGREAAAALVASGPLPWQVVADDDVLLSRSAGIDGWPTVVVLQPDGTEVARLAAGTDALRFTLAPYLQLAVHATDAAAARQRLIPADVVGDGPSTRPSRQARLADELLQAGNPDQAKMLLSQALQRDPGSIPLRVAMIKTLARQKNETDAITQLDRLPAGALSQDESDLLRARVMIDLDRWEDAREALNAALTRSPRLSDAHYLLGQVFEHDGDYPKAAAAYRAMRDGRDARR